MADAKRCDICKKFYDIYLDHRKQPEDEWRPQFTSVMFLESDIMGAKYELCPECQNKFVNFMAKFGMWAPEKEEN